jgi:hypothetical protein
MIQDSAYSAVWAEAAKKALTPAQCRSPLGRRPYDLTVSVTAPTGPVRGFSPVRGPSPA